MITPGGRPGDSTPLGHKGKRRLDDYVRAVAHALMRKGYSKGHAIAVAKNSLKRWSAGGGKVRPQVRAGAAAHLGVQKGIDASLSEPMGSSQDGLRLTALSPANKAKLIAELKRRKKKPTNLTDDQRDALIFDLSEKIGDLDPDGWVELSQMQEEADTRAAVVAELQRRKA